MKREYLALGVIYHDETRYMPGDVLELNDEHADRLLSVGMVKPVDQNNDGRADRAESERGRRASGSAEGAQDADDGDNRPLLDPETTGLESTAGKGKSGRKRKGA